MKVLTQFEIRVLVFPNTPILHYSFLKMSILI